MEFGKAEAETGYDDETVGLGMIGSAGRVRGEVADARSKGESSSCHVVSCHVMSCFFAPGGRIKSPSHF